MLTRRGGSTLRRVAGELRDQFRQRIDGPPADRVRRRAAARLTDLSHRLDGLAYRVADRRPDPHVDDGVLTQRVRSQLGPLERQLDIPRLHVTVRDRIAHVRGVVDTNEHAETIFHAVEDVAGVHGVVSSLHVGLGPGDTRPSQGRSQQAPSEPWRDLVGCVRALDEDESTAAALVTAALVHLLDVLPEGERGHLLGHLPADVKGHIDRFVHIGEPPHPRSADEFIAAVSDSTHVPRDTADMATRQVFATLQQLVPEETADITATLPGNLKDLWRTPLGSTAHR